MLKDIYDDIELRMKASLDNLEKNFRSLRTGRASTALLDNIRLDYYGTPTPLNQVATLTVPEHNLIVIQPWDGSVIGDIEKAINKANLGLVPQNDGKLIRLSIPPLTEERRKEVAKTVKKYAEECRVAIRQIRRDGNDNIKMLEKEKEISEDQAFKAQGEVQNIIQKYQDKIDKITAKKEEEVLTM